MATLSTKLVQEFLHEVARRTNRARTAVAKPEDPKATRLKEFFSKNPFDCKTDAAKELAQIITGLPINGVSEGLLLVVPTADNSAHRCRIGVPVVTLWKDIFVSVEQAAHRSMRKDEWRLATAEEQIAFMNSMGDEQRINSLWTALWNAGIGEVTKALVTE